jgi:hypothetical protein
MFDTEPNKATDSRQIIRHHRDAAQAKWERLTVADYIGISTTAELIAAVATRYSLPLSQAKLDVEDWLDRVGSQD